MYANKKTEITANKTKCKYAITIGLNPNAKSLTAGIVEPNCNNNLIENAMPTTKNKFNISLVK